MSPQMLPDELMLSITEGWPCRELQIRQLASILSPSLPSPPSLVLCGSRATGKSGVIGAYLNSYQLQHAIVRCQECVTGRQLLESTVGAVRDSIRSASKINGVKDDDSRCESLSVLAVQLQHLLGGLEKFVLVLDGIDKQREAPPTLLPALARLGEIIPSLTVVLVVQQAPPRFLHHTGVPHIRFPPYTRSQSIHILSRKPLDIFVEPPPPELNYDDEVHEEDKAWLWPRFCAAVWDTLAQNTARDLGAFRDACYKLWPQFVRPIVAGDFGTRDFSRLLVAQRKLFQEESMLLNSILSISTRPSSEPERKTNDLPFYTKWLLVAAYLASFNPARFDAIYFMKTTERKKRKKGGGAMRSGGGRPLQTRKIPRHLLAASIFTLDRLLAILQAILPEDFRSDINIYRQITTLTSLKLLLRAGGLGSGDPLEPGGKWRVGPMLSWEYVQHLARSVDFNITDYVVE